MPTPGIDPDKVTVDNDGTVHVTDDPKYADTDITTKDTANADDTDGDGLTDKEGKELGTDLNKADSDGNGFADGDEAVAGTDPTDKDSYPKAKDTDGDGVPDDQEIADATDPNNPDSDGDELKAGTDPLNKDSDGDGFTDKEEIDGGTDPIDPNDPAKLNTLRDAAYELIRVVRPVAGNTVDLAANKLTVMW